MEASDELPETSSEIEIEIEIEKVEKTNLQNLFEAVYHQLDRNSIPINQNIDFMVIIDDWIDKNVNVYLGVKASLFCFQMYFGVGEYNREYKPREISRIIRSTKQYPGLSLGTISAKIAVTTKKFIQWTVDNYESNTQEWVKETFTRKLPIFLPEEYLQKKSINAIVHLKDYEIAWFGELSAIDKTIWSMMIAVGEYSYDNAFLVFSDIFPAYSKEFLVNRMMYLKARYDLVEKTERFRSGAKKRT